MSGGAKEEGEAHHAISFILNCVQESSELLEGSS